MKCETKKVPAEARAIMQLIPTGIRFSLSGVFSRLFHFFNLFLGIIMVFASYLQALYYSRMTAWFPRDKNTLSNWSFE